MIPPSATLKARGKQETERLLATVALGLAEAVRAHAMSPSDACGLFFVPAFCAFQSRSGIDRELIDALHAGAELADVERLAPRGLVGALDDIAGNAKRVLGKMAPSPNPLNRKWLAK